MTKVKICGLKDPLALEAALQAGADYVGFVFAKSKRQISPQEAKDLVRQVPSQIKKVGVFASPSLDQIEAVLKEVELDFIQIHGDFSNQHLAKLPLPVIRAYQIGKEMEEVGHSPAAYLLFDAPLAGSGQTFDWQKLDSKAVTKPFFIAGGLNVDNVLEAIEHFSPYAVDVSSGVETRGQKDPLKIKEFIERVKYGL
ncbi:phosphoribosylanthranilate isomerase [Streptococcus oricebi]|uniref:N-(5'-phosphoribosyl)anthranilate isomerase n=1 Tax=Streptococcus oricebi TaxID=1547447 RepID=A0ABS5B432_9STRE|nr:phosphoribosylanthranilate isomerase [Streptococcus oricebi]MBP2622744.1 phosphoribosylanthranilate isomerase [Streptococcus oricebi]